MGDDFPWRLGVLLGLVLLAVATRFLREIADGLRPGPPKPRPVLDDRLPWEV